MGGAWGEADGKPKSGKLVQYWESRVENVGGWGGQGWLGSNYLACFVLEEYQLIILMSVLKFL